MTAEIILTPRHPTANGAAMGWVESYGGQLLETFAQTDTRHDLFSFWAAPAVPGLSTDSTANVRVRVSVQHLANERVSVVCSVSNTDEGGFAPTLSFAGQTLAFTQTRWLEAKAEGLSPLVGKEQARKYAKSQNCRFVILSNGNLHYFWDLERGNPYIITAFPTPAS